MAGEWSAVSSGGTASKALLQQQKNTHVEICPHTHQTVPDRFQPRAVRSERVTEVAGANLMTGELNEECRHLLQHRQSACPYGKRRSASKVSLRRHIHAQQTTRCFASIFIHHEKWACKFCGYFNQKCKKVERFGTFIFHS